MAKAGSVFDAITESAVGETFTVTETVRGGFLNIPEGVRLAAPSGYELTLVVNGVEVDVAPGPHVGDVALVVTEQTIVPFAFGGVRHDRHFRQALYLDASGIVPSKSVTDAGPGARLENGRLTGAAVVSSGELFNGVHVTDGEYVVKDAILSLEGNGGDDFTGWGAAVLASGAGTRLTLDNVRIRTRGTVRTGVVIDKGATLIVRRSDIRTRDGVPPEDYVPNVDLGQMKGVPWMLGLQGNCRATSLLGTATVAAYCDSVIEAENWGVLSCDVSENPRLAAVNSTVLVSGESGYGAYAICGAELTFLGTRFDVRDYGVVIDNGQFTDTGPNSVVLGASTPDAVAALNDSLGLGYSEEELRSLPTLQTSVRSGRFGAMFHMSGASNSAASVLEIRDATELDTNDAIFLVRGVPAQIRVDGSRGARLNSRKNIILQLIDSDDPGPVLVDGRLLNEGVYHERAGAPERVAGFDAAVETAGDVVACFSDIALVGDVFNGYRDGTGAQRISAEVTGLAPVPDPQGKNVVLNFERSSVEGVLSSSLSRHEKDTIGAEDYKLIGVVTHVPTAAVNNGLIVNLVGSTWTVTGTSYLTSLTIDDTSQVVAAGGGTPKLLVDGTPVPLAPGSYRGAIVVEAD
ncbi:hypothetical protein [Streptomyces sp. NPDC058867]|uniref:hypothetical protein n=1 Tax=unclassified Streptomyces TaxID=2593676 RepID=UPI00367CC16A